jgi:hypothetical protein
MRRFFLTLLFAGLAILVACSSTPATATGPWGNPCWAVDSAAAPDSGIPRVPEMGNKACGTAPAFGCYGTGTTDANAFCTKFGCGTDADCTQGWWCATVNQSPNVETDKFALGVTRTVCVPRTYCAPCASDRDCAPAHTTDVARAHCLPDSQGTNFCAPICATQSNCPLDAACIPQWSMCTPGAGKACSNDDDCPLAGGRYQHCDSGHCTSECGSDAECAAGQTCQLVRTCMPRAGACVGDGSFCSPCRSDADCGAGYCIDASPYSTERFCTTQSTALACDPQLVNPPGCPRPSRGVNWKSTRCFESRRPPNAEFQCYGVVTLGVVGGMAQEVPGCWTLNR